MVVTAREVFHFGSLQVVEALSLPAALKLVSACCGEDLWESDEAAVEVSPPFMCGPADLISPHPNPNANNNTNPIRSSTNVGACRWR